MTLYELLYPSERAACKEADLRNCHFYDLTVQELSAIKFKNLIEFSEFNTSTFSSAEATLRELYSRIHSYTTDQSYFLNKPQTTKEGL